MAHHFSKHILSFKSEFFPQIPPISRQLPKSSLLLRELGYFWKKNHHDAAFLVVFRHFILRLPGLRLGDVAFGQNLWRASSTAPVCA
jgi:hypothetical protein